ncbi:MAG: TonB-dependent receptor plug domain-containing protein [Cytophagaceae bacterium]|jgi:hypothetical protein|nr:TonB-dependent receptor plug domain-containing protein [Cytophagaceae bacterium]
MIRAFFFILITGLLQISAAQTITISGSVSNELHELSIGVVVREIKTGKTVKTNDYGFYSLSFIPADTIELVFAQFGYQKVKKIFVPPFPAEIKLDIQLEESAKLLKEVVVKGKRPVDVKEEVNSTQMSAVTIQAKEIKNIPVLGGESDLIKVAQLMPGIARGSEGSTGMYVRGGTDDQNLILMDEATVYNVGHLFGFFSLFNTDAVKNVKIIKGGFPANYGGRLSSIVDVHTNDGSDSKYAVTGGVGLLSSRLTVEGPIKKEKLSFLIAGRRTYIDKVAGLVNIPLPYYFYDVNFKLKFSPNERNKFYFSNYFGNDVMEFSDERRSAAIGFGFRLGNITNTLRWNHIYNSKLFSNISFISTRFSYDINAEYSGRSFVDTSLNELSKTSLFVRSKINDLGIKADWDYNLNKKHQMKFGWDFIHHNFRPNLVSTAGDISEFINSKDALRLSTQEASLYINDVYEPKKIIAFDYGLRWSNAFVKGAYYSGLEPRFSIRYSLTPSSSFKASYTRMRQYMHRVTSSSISLPTDLWYPISANLKPQTANQVALGYYLGWDKFFTNFSVELYYKEMTRLIEYREGARLFLNESFEQELVIGNGRSYGAEFLLRKKEGKFTGWIGYTLSWAKRQFDDLNKSMEYFAKYDRRHDISLVAMYDISKKVSVSGVWIISSGSRITPIKGSYFMPNTTFSGIEIIPLYGNRNALVLQPVHRLDVNFIIKSIKVRKFQGEWHIGAYNFYNRAAPYRTNIVSTASGYTYQQQGLFGFIPSIAYNFKF